MRVVCVLVCTRVRANSVLRIGRLRGKEREHRTNIDGNQKRDNKLTQGGHAHRETTQTDYTERLHRETTQRHYTDRLPTDHQETEYTEKDHKETHSQRRIETYVQPPRETDVTHRGRGGRESARERTDGHKAGDTEVTRRGKAWRQKQPKIRTEYIYIYIYIY